MQLYANNKEWHPPPYFNYTGVPLPDRADSTPLQKLKAANAEQNEVRRT